MKVLAIILAGGKRRELSSLVKDRSKAAVPFFGKYRVIDFVLSNCLNSGIRKVNIVVQHRFASLQKHIRDAWSIYSSTMGEYIDIYPPQQRKGERFYSGTADSVYQNLFSIEDENPDYILVLPGDYIYKMDYSKLINFHIENKAGLTIASSPTPISKASLFGVIECSDTHKVTSFREKPYDISYLRGDTCLVSMGLYVFSTAVLKDIFYSSEKNKKEFQGFGSQIIPDLVESGQVFTYPFLNAENKPAYWNILGSIEGYYQSNMDILNKRCEINLYDRGWPYRSYQSQSAPTRAFIEDNNPACIVNSAISGGGAIEGQIVNSILGTNVTVARGAVIEDSILFDNVFVKENAFIKKAIIDKGIAVAPNLVVSSEHKDNWTQSSVFSDDIIVLGKGATKLP